MNINIKIQHQTSGRLEEGMDLRDYFAAKALQGYLANSRYDEFDHTTVKYAYQMADAMMEARNK